MKYTAYGFTLRSESDKVCIKEFDSKEEASAYIHDLLLLEVNIEENVTFITTAAWSDEYADELLKKKESLWKHISEISEHSETVYAEPPYSGIDVERVESYSAWQKKTMQPIVKTLQKLSLFQLKKLCCIVYYDTNVDNLDTSTKDEIIDGMTNISTQDTDEYTCMFLKNNEWWISVREGKVGDVMKFDDLLSSMYTGENWRGCTYENEVGLGKE